MRRIDLLGVDDVPVGTMKMAWAEGSDPVLVINQEGEFTAIQGICSHEYFELDKGFLTDGSITCALHFSRFQLDDGEPLDPPAELPLVTFAASELDGEIVLELPEGEIPVNE